MKLSILALCILWCWTAIADPSLDTSVKKAVDLVNQQKANLNSNLQKQAENCSPVDVNQSPMPGLISRFYKMDESGGGQPLVFDRNSPECKLWTLAHKEFCGDEEYEASKTLLSAVKYVSYQELQGKLIEGIREFKEKIKGEEFAIVVSPGKSTEWLIEKVEPELKGAHYTKISADKMESFVKNHPGVVHFLNLDDASYSGQQMGETTYRIRKLLAKKKKEANIHLVIPFSTARARRHIETLLKSNRKFEPSAFEKYFDEDESEKYPQAHVFYYGNQSIVNDISKDFDHHKSKKTLEKMYSEFEGGSDEDGFSSRALLFFEHKVPDEESTIEDFFGFGFVTCKDGKILRGKTTKKPIEFHCIPFVMPPYKAGYAWTYKDRPMGMEFGCLNTPDGKWKNSDKECVNYLEDKKNLIQSNFH